MPTTINASNTTGGAVVTGDGSGILELQSGGVTGITVNGPNVTVAGTLTATGGSQTPLVVGGTPSVGAQIRLNEATANGTNFVAVKAADNLAANTTFTLPTADGTNGQYLRTDGAGNLSFATVPVTSPAGTTGQVQINNAGAFGAVASGTSGQALISQGAGLAPTWGVPGLSGFQKVSSNLFTPTVGLSGAVAGTANGQSYTLDADRTLYFTIDSTSGIVGFVYNRTTSTMGSPVAIRSGSYGTSNYQAIIISASSVLLCSCQGATTAVQGVILSISGTTITVNTAASLTLPGNMDGTGGLSLITIGTSYVLSVTDNTNTQYLAYGITVSGTTVTFGSSTVIGSSSSSFRAQMQDIGSNRVAFIYGSAANQRIEVSTYSVSGTTLTSVGTANTGATTFLGTIFTTCLLSTGRIAIVFNNYGSNTPSGAIASFAAGVPSITTVTLATSGGLSNMAISPVGNQVVCYFYIGGTTHSVNVLTDNAGTAVAGTQISSLASSTGLRVRNTPTGLWLWMQGLGQVWNITISGNNPVISNISSVPVSNNTSISGPTAGFDTNIGLAGVSPQVPYNLRYFVSSSGTAINASGTSTSSTSWGFNGTSAKSYTFEPFFVMSLRESDDTVVAISATSTSGASVLHVIERWKFVG